MAMIRHEIEGVVLALRCVRCGAGEQVPIESLTLEPVASPGLYDPRDNPWLAGMSMTATGLAPITSDRWGYMVTPAWEDGEELTVTRIVCPACRRQDPASSRQEPPGSTNGRSSDDHAIGRALRA